MRKPLLFLKIWFTITGLMIGFIAVGMTIVYAIQKAVEKFGDAAIGVSIFLLVTLIFSLFIYHETA